GHSVPGFGTCDDGVVIDFSGMRGVRVDPTNRTARAEGGATWGDLNAAAHAFGLATTGGIISTTGVAGLTLGGGIGYLDRGFGLSCADLLPADVVTADGPRLAMVACWAGPIAQGEKALKPFHDVAPVVAEFVGAMPYPALNSAFDALVPPGLQHYWKANFVTEITDDIIAAHEEHGPKVPV